jgi:hypothetical protein
MLSTCCIRSGSGGVGCMRRTVGPATANLISATQLHRSTSAPIMSSSTSSSRLFSLAPERLMHESRLPNTIEISFHQQRRPLASTSTVSRFFPKTLFFPSYSTTMCGVSVRPFSSLTSTAQNPSSAATSKDAKKGIGDNNNNNNNNNISKHDNSSLFFDNLGKIFLLVIASIIASLVRSSAGTRNRNVLRDALEDIALVDPMELEDLRLANSSLDPETFRAILKQVYQSFPQGTCSYQEFVHCVRKNMAQLKGAAFTIELGHLLDRLMVQVLNKHKVKDDSSNNNMPVTLFLTALTMALYSDTKERIRILYEILQLQEGHSGQHPSPLSVEDGESDHSRTTVTIDQVRSMVGYLQETCQLPPDTQIIPTETKYPTQQWKRGSPRDLVPWSGGTDRDLIDLYTFASILRSKSVCAWGECYYKRKFEADDV